MSAAFQLPTDSRIGSHLSVLWIAIALAWTLVGTHAADQRSAFDDANVLYEQGDYPAAAEAYRQLIENGSDSAAIRFNLANTLYQSSQIGQALHQYFEALARSPRDPDILANIQFARKKLGTNAAVQRSFWQQFLLQLTLKEWTLIAVATFWVWLLIAASGILLRSKGGLLPALTRLCGIVCLVSVALLANAANDRLGTTYGVVTAPEAVVRFGPFEESKSSHNLADGMEIELIDEKDGWFQIRDAQEQIGWLRTNQVLQLRFYP